MLTSGLCIPVRVQKRNRRRRHHHHHHHHHRTRYCSGNNGNGNEMHPMLPTIFESQETDAVVHFAAREEASSSGAGAAFVIDMKDIRRIITGLNLQSCASSDLIGMCNDAATKGTIEHACIKRVLKRKTLVLCEAPLIAEQLREQFFRFLILLSDSDSSSSSGSGSDCQRYGIRILYMSMCVFEIVNALNTLTVW